MLRVMYDAMLYGLCVRAFVIVHVMFLLINVFVFWGCDLGCGDVWCVWFFLFYVMCVLVCLCLSVFVCFACDGVWCGLFVLFVYYCSCGRVALYVSCACVY